MINNYDDALKFLITYLRNPDKYLQAIGYSDYGYDIYLSNVILRYLIVEEKMNRDKAEAYLYQNDLSPYFFDAAWELCRRGILRPGVKVARAQSTGDGSAGTGYCVTIFGKYWLSEDTYDDFVPTEPERFGQMLMPYREICGEIFYQRAQEAVRCYGAHAYLACCVMCGAASESILLSIAYNLKPKDEVDKSYNTSRGRSNIENLIIGQASEKLKKEFQGLLILLKYWRDTAGHGKPTIISENEAYTSLAFLMRFAMFVTDRWDELTSKR
ncbi:MAG: hypothetical protein WCO98_11230 [bacterium]